MSDDNKWREEDFHRRHYTIQGELEDKRIEVSVKVGGKTMVQVELREPGVLAIVSRPEEEGIDVEIVGPGGVRYTDVRLPSGQSTPPLTPWLRDALFAKKAPPFYSDGE